MYAKLPLYNLVKQETEDMKRLLYTKERKRGYQSVTHMGGLYVVEGYKYRTMRQGRDGNQGETHPQEELSRASDT